MLSVANVTPRFHSSHASRGAQSAWLRHIGLVNDFIRVPYANGSNFATQFLYREFRARGHQVTVVGPTDPEARPDELPARYVGLPSMPLRVHPGGRRPCPRAAALRRIAAQRFDLVLAQTASALSQLGVWLRATHHVPFLSVNTVHLPSIYNNLLPDALHANRVTNSIFSNGLVPWLEKQSVDVYNRGDGLIVLSRGLEKYWRERGVEVPIYVIPRSVEPKIFDRQVAVDPFASAATPRGGRLLCVCRHVREKQLDRLIDLFARHIAPNSKEATLTLVGEGPDHDAIRAHAAASGAGDRIFFPGELSVTELPAYYRHADLFVYASLSETYGQVVSEALFCGLPVVAFADAMGVSDQIEHEQTGMLVDPGPDHAQADLEFATHVLRLLRQPAHLRLLSQRARAKTRARVHPERIVDLHYSAFELAQRHCAATVERRVQRPFAHLGGIGVWAGVHAVVTGLGHIRKEAVINRHSKRQPGWHDFEGAAPAQPERSVELRDAWPAE